MTVYEPEDAITVVTQGVDTTPAYDAGELTDAFDVMNELHPDVRLAYRDDSLLGAHQDQARVRWTVPGAARPRTDYDYYTWRRDVPAALGALDAAAHMLITEREGESIAAQGSFTRLLENPDVPDLAAACARWRPARTVALITDAGGMVPTDRGVWFTRLPPRATVVPVGHNLGAYLTRVFPSTPEDDPLSDDVLLPAFSFYWDAVHHVLDRHPGPECHACERAIKAHRPTVEQVRHYASIATETAPSP
ncbi:hypothetical protein OG948_59505 (plasmid) [Embleya sp. NBC_00888]|uniref:hypothetical protein n=1 Tax=Embleya sp. NBC_00888 TaxID=2975960 RepID=UPI002F90E450|nr:hypothetical protein OG948_59505 [Embleya sp. NBC_00888]